MFGLPSIAFYAIVAGVVFLAGLTAGIKVEGWRCSAKDAARMEAANAARQVDEEKTALVATAYEGIREELRRITTVNRVELTREVQKIEYRCPVPADAVRLLNDSIRAANTAAGQPDPALPADPAADGERPGRAGERLFGADGDLR
jgi:hypothetical protein